ncbi:MAG: 3-deoxy-7-phosphoheptulonate synthase [Gemmatimonadaceae bacterium]
MSETPLIARTRSLQPYTVRVAATHAPPLQIGADHFVVAAGPCSVEGMDMLLETAHSVRAAGATLLRGGAFKPRTSPYAFQGLGAVALEMLVEARRVTGLSIVTEALDVRHVELVAGAADMIQVGARNMQNVPLLSAVADTGKPVLLKRGASATIRELLSAAEYLAVRGNTQVVLCERGIRTFEPATRNTLDISAVPVLKRETDLPVFVDPSHASGDARYVRALARAALAAGADGLLIEVHPSPADALSDGEQSLTLDEFALTMRELSAIASVMGRSLRVGSMIMPIADARRGVA